MDPQDRSQKEIEAKRSRRSISKFDKEVPRYECFCTKQYLSYPALYLHLKNKHQNYFQSSKNGKKVETTKLVESFDSSQGFKVYKIPIDPLSAEKLKQDQTVPSAKHFEGQGFNENPLYYPANNYIAYGNIPYQYPYQYLANKEENSPIAKEALIQAAFSMYAESLTILSVKEKAQTQLLLGLLIYYINENYTILKDFGEQAQFRRYTAENTCKYLSLFLSFFEKKWLPQAIKQENKFYSFFVKHSNIIVGGKYKKIFQELLQFVDGQKYEDMSEPEIIKSHQPLPQQNDNQISQPPASNEAQKDEPKHRIKESSPK